jgi:hypothetical protein
MPPPGNGTVAMAGNEAAVNSTKPTLLPPFNQSESMYASENGTHADTSNETVSNSEVTLQLSGSKSKLPIGNETSVNSISPTLSPTIRKSDENIFDLEGVPRYNESIPALDVAKTPNNSTRLTRPMEYQTTTTRGDGVSVGILENEDKYKVKMLDPPSHDIVHGLG